MTPPYKNVVRSGDITYGAAAVIGVNRTPHGVTEQVRVDAEKILVDEEYKDVLTVSIRTEKKYQTIGRLVDGEWEPWPFN